jgi:hypothetical protein
MLYNKRKFYFFRLYKIGNNSLISLLLDLAVEVRTLRCQFDFVFVAGMQIEGRESEIILTTLTEVNLIYLL